MQNFTQLGLQAALARRCESLGYTEPTPIQKQAIPLVLEGYDLIGVAETGTGKTAAFLLPTLQRMADEPRPGTRVLVLAPTRELASQIEASYKQLAPKGAPRCANVIGGASMSKQNDALRRGAGIVIATPGRLLDHVERGTVNLSHIEVLVLDEADRMLDMGFLPQIRRVLALLPRERQTLLFSATMPFEVEELARRTMNEPKLVEVSRRGRPTSLVEQTAYAVAAESKTALLLDLLERERESDNFERVLIFTRTRRAAERLAHILAARDHSVVQIHADRTQPQREAALRGFKEGRTRILVATDIAARGIDVESVSHVVNYDVPEEPEAYVHRIGRTGRAGKVGKAITLVSPVEELQMRAIERLTGQAVERVAAHGFAPASHAHAGAHRASAATTFAAGATAPSGAKPFRALRRAGSSSRRSFRPRRAGR